MQARGRLRRPGRQLHIYLDLLDIHWKSEMYGSGAPAQGRGKSLMYKFGDALRHIQHPGVFAHGCGQTELVEILKMSQTRSAQRPRPGEQQHGCPIELGIDPPGHGIGVRPPTAPRGWT